jgi:hypothetical protein
MKQNHKTFLGIVGLLVIAGIVFITHSRLLDSSKSNARNTPVSVNGISISKDTLDAEEKKDALFQQWLKKEKIKEGTGDEKTIDMLIEKTIAQEYAKKNGITVSQTEIEKQFQKAAASIGGEEKYLEKLKEIYGVDKKGVYDMLSYDLLKQKISQKTKLPFAVWIKEEKAKAKIETDAR